MERFPTNVQDTGQLSATPKLSNCINSTVRAPHSSADRTCSFLFRLGLITVPVAIALMTNFMARGPKTRSASPLISLAHAPLACTGSSPDSLFPPSFIRRLFDQLEVDLLAAKI